MMKCLKMQVWKATYLVGIHSPTTLLGARGGFFEKSSYDTPQNVTRITVSLPKMSDLYAKMKS